MTCADSKERLGAWVDGELNAGDIALLRAHVGTCDECQAELEALRNLATQLAGAPQPVLPAALWPAIERRITAENRDSSNGRGAIRHPAQYGRRLSPAHRWAAAAAIVLAIGLGLSAWNVPWATPAQAAQIDFRPLLQQADGDIEAGIRALIRAHGGKKLTPQEAQKIMKVRIHPPAQLPHDLQLRGMYLLHMGDQHRSLAFHFAGPRGQLLMLQCPAGVKREMGNYECLPCRIGADSHQAVCVGTLRLMHRQSENTCICIVATLDEQTELPAVLDAITIDY